MQCGAVAAPANIALPTLLHRNNHTQNYLRSRDISQSRLSGLSPNSTEAAVLALSQMMGRVSHLRPHTCRGREIAGTHVDKYPCLCCVVDGRNGLTGLGKWSRKRGAKKEGWHIRELRTPAYCWH
jgi:hypothetical protein